MLMPARGFLRYCQVPKATEDFRRLLPSGMRCTCLNHINDCEMTVIDHDTQEAVWIVRAEYCSILRPPTPQSHG
jgi:hypothetical protein